MLKLLVYGHFNGLRSSRKLAKQSYDTSLKTKKKFNVEKIEVLADKGYFETSDLKKCEEEDITCYVSKPRYSNNIGDSRYFSDKFKYNSQENTYICPEGQVLYCITKKVAADQKIYVNHEASSYCPNKSKCTESSKGRTITRKVNEEIAEIVNMRTKDNNAKYARRQEIIEHVFGTVKRSMNFDYLLLIGFKKVSGEVSIAFFSYNLKRVINILGADVLLRYLINGKIIKTA